MILKKLIMFSAAIAAVFIIGVAEAGAKADYMWSEQNVIQISGIAASKKAGVNVVVQILKPGEDLSTLTPENMEYAVAYHNQIKTGAGGAYSVSARLDNDTDNRIALIREADGASIQSIDIQPNDMTAEAVFDAVGHMYYDCTKIPMKIKTSKSGKFNVSVKLTDASGLSGKSVIKTFTGVDTDLDNVVHITLNLENDAMKYGVFNAECTVSKAGEANVVCNTQFSVSRMTEKGEENRRIGVTQHFFSMQKTGDIDTELDMMQKAGIKLQRQSVYWDTFETGYKNYQFNERTQQYFDLLGEKRLGGIVQVFGGNGLYYPKNADGSYKRDENGNLMDFPPNTPEVLKAFGDYAYNLAEQTKAYTNCYEVWNEYNITSFNPRNLPASNYADMLKAVYGRIHEANPDAVVIAMALAGCDEEALVWVRNVLEAGKGEIMLDAVSLHPYKQPESLESSAYIKRVKDLFAEYGYTDISVYISETGYSTGRTGTNDAEQAKRQVRNLALLSDDAEQIYIYNAFEKQNTTDAEKGYGIIRGQFDGAMPYYAKPAYVAVANFNKLTGNYQEVVQTSPESGVYVVKFTKKDGKRCWMLWTVKSGGQVYELDTEGCANVSKYDIYGNSEAMVSSNGKYSINLTDAPVYIEAKSPIEVKYIDMAGFTVDTLNNTATIDAVVDIRVPTANAELYAASYKDNTLIECKRAEASAGTHTLTVNTADADRVAVYYWNGATMEPLLDRRLNDLTK
jgi:hypothetical protein